MNEVPNSTQGLPKEPWNNVNSHDLPRLAYRVEEVARQLENELGIGFGRTTQDGLFSLEYCNCLGMCDHGPALLVNNDVYTEVSPELVSDILEKYRRMFGPASQLEEKEASHA